jgi:hypothetical protein
MKVCQICKETKSFDHFDKASRYNLYPTSSAGYQYRCKVCRLNSQKKRREICNKINRNHYASSKKRRDSIKNRNLYTKFGITLEQYNNMFLSQGGCCKICDTHQTDLKKTLAVDHCHKTGNIRGLLCHHCNVALGYLKENDHIMQNMIDYVKKHKPELAEYNTNVVHIGLKKAG